MDKFLEDSPVHQKSFNFALRIIALANYLQEEKHQYILAKQILRSGTSIGANIRESRYAPSGLDFINKLNISLKEADETEYWLDLLWKSNIISETQAALMLKDLHEITRLLISIIKKRKNNLSKQ